MFACTRLAEPLQQELPFNPTDTCMLLSLMPTCALLWCAILFSDLARSILFATKDVLHDVNFPALALDLVCFGTKGTDNILSVQQH